MPINKPYVDVAALPSVAPVFPLKGVLLLPRGELPLNIFEPRYVAMINSALAGDRLIGMIQPAMSSSGLAATPALESTGCLGRITQFSETGDGRYTLNLTGVIRFRVVAELTAATVYRQCQIQMNQFAADLKPDSSADGIDRDELLGALKEYSDAKGMQVDWRGVAAATAEALVNMVSMAFPFDPGEKQGLLESVDLKARAKLLMSIAQPRPRNPQTLH